jgi:hypothetical protein
VPSGYKVIIKAKKTYGDSLYIRENAFGSLTIDNDGKTGDMTLAQASLVALETLKIMVVGWDATDDGSTTIAIDEKSIKETFTDEDVSFLMSEIGIGTAPDPKL